MACLGQKNTIIRGLAASRLRDTRNFRGSRAGRAKTCVKPRGRRRVSGSTGAQSALAWTSQTGGGVLRVTGTNWFFALPGDRLLRLPFTCAVLILGASLISGCGSWFHKKQDLDEDVAAPDVIYGRADTLPHTQTSHAPPHPYSNIHTTPPHSHT